MVTTTCRCDLSRITALFPASLRGNQSIFDLTFKHKVVEKLTSCVCGHEYKVTGRFNRDTMSLKGVFYHGRSRPLILLF